MSDGERIYVVTAYIEDEVQPRGFNVTAASPEEAEEAVAADEGVEEVITEMTQEFAGTYRMSISGSPKEITDALNHLDHFTSTVDADMEIEDVTPVVWPADEDMNDGDAIRAAVGQWDDLEMRVVGHDLDGPDDTLCINADSVLAHEQSVVEVVAGNEVLVRAMLKGAGLPVPDDDTVPEGTQ